MRRRYHLHLPGIVFSVIVLMIGLMAMHAQNNLLFWIFGVLFSGLLISGVISGVMMLGIDLHRIDPEHGQVGQPLLMRYAITNRNRLTPIFNIHIEERPVNDRNGWQSMVNAEAVLPAWVMHVGPRETVHGESVFWPTRRGDARFGMVRIWTTFPFGIIKKSVTVNRPMRTLVYPRMFELRQDVLALVDSPAPLGMRVTQRPGAGDDYYGLREYRESDSVRNIAWKRSASADQLLCIDRSRPSPPKLRVVLDLSRPTDRLRVVEGESARDLEEQAISLAASVIQLADAAGFEIGLTILGVKRPSFPVRRNHWHFRRMIAALAEVALDGPRIGREDAADLAADGQPASLLDQERAGLVIIQPDRADPLCNRSDAAYLTARQLDNLAIAPMGWEPEQLGHRPPSQSARPSVSHHVAEQATAARS